MNEEFTEEQITAAVDVAAELANVWNRPMVTHQQALLEPATGGVEIHPHGIAFIEDVVKLMAEKGAVFV